MSDTDFYLAWRGIAIVLKTVLEGMIQENMLDSVTLSYIEARLNEIGNLIRGAQIEKDTIPS